MKMQSSEYVDMENYWTQDKLQTIYMKQGNLALVETRHKYLQEQLEHLESELRAMETERNIG